MKKGITLKDHWRSKLKSQKERKIFDSLLSHFPKSHPASAYDAAINGGINWHLINKH